MNGGSAQGQLMCTNQLTTPTATARRHRSAFTAETRGQKSKQTRTDHNDSQAQASNCGKREILGLVIHTFDVIDIRLRPPASGNLLQPVLENVFRPASENVHPPSALLEVKVYDVISPHRWGPLVPLSKKHFLPNAKLAPVKYFIANTITQFALTVVLSHAHGSYLDYASYHTVLETGLVTGADCTSSVSVDFNTLDAFKQTTENRISAEAATGVHGELVDVGVQGWTLPARQSIRLVN